MTGRRIAIAAAAVLLQFFAFALDAQITPQTLPRPTPQARQQLAKALQEYREKKDLHGEAFTLLQLGTVDAALGNVDSARSNLLEASRKMRAQNDVMGEWLALLALSQIDIALGRPSEAIHHIEKALAVISEAKTSTAPFNLKTFLDFGSISGISIQVPQGLDDSTAALIKPMLIQYSLEPMTHDLYGGALTQVGQLEKAEIELKAAVAGAVYAQGMYDFSIEAHFGDLRFRQQRYDEAREHYVKALSSSLKMAQAPAIDRQIKRGIYDRLVRLETITGHPEEAKRWSEMAGSL